MLSGNIELMLNPIMNIPKDAIKIGNTRLSIIENGILTTKYNTITLIIINKIFMLERHIYNALKLSLAARINIGMKKHKYKS